MKWFSKRKAPDVLSTFEGCRDIAELSVFSIMDGGALIEADAAELGARQAFAAYGKGKEVQINAMAAAIESRRVYVWDGIPHG